MGVNRFSAFRNSTPAQCEQGGYTGYKQESGQSGSPPVQRHMRGAVRDQITPGSCRGWNAESGLSLLAIAGDPVPDAGPGATLGSIPSSIDNPTIASEADIGFHGSFDEGSGASLTGAFALGEAGALTLVAGAGFEVPGIPGATFTWFRERRLTSC